MHFAQAAKACVSNILQMSKFNFQKSMNDSNSYFLNLFA